MDIRQTTDNRQLTTSLKRNLLSTEAIVCDDGGIQLDVYVGIQYPYVYQPYIPYVNGGKRDDVTK